MQGVVLWNKDRIDDEKRKKRIGEKTPGMWKKPHERVPGDKERHTEQPGIITKAGQWTKTWASPTESAGETAVG